MDAHGWIAVGTLVATIVLFVTRWIPRMATALAIPVVLTVTLTLEPAEALAGFGNHAVIAIGAIFIIGAGLKESGVATFTARGLEKLSGRGERRILLVITVPVCILSAFMSSAATVAVFLPAVAMLARRLMIPDSRLLMPLGFAAVLGGTLTLIGAMPNLIVAGELARLKEGAELGMFEFAVVGLPAAFVGILYLVTVGRRLLPERSTQDL
ncbi:MAG: SLC13 family permease, partial [Planctomycetota bacterium]